MVKFNEIGFDFAYEMHNPMPPEYGTLNLDYISMDRTLNKTSGLYSNVWRSTPIETVLCGTTNFNFSDEVEQTVKGIASLNCIKDKSFLTLGGTWLSTSFR
jgi:hypothetical protein